MQWDDSLKVALGFAAALVGKHGYTLVKNWITGTRVYDDGSGIGSCSSKLTEEKVRTMIRESREQGVKEILTEMRSTSERQIEALGRIENTNTQIRDAVVALRESTEGTKEILINLLTSNRFSGR